MSLPLNKSHRTAVVIIPPDDCFQQIQDIRREHDKAYERWMPHINLLYPFLLDREHGYNQIGQTMIKGLTEIKPFSVCFTKESFGHFTHGKRSTVWLKPLPAPLPAPLPVAKTTGAAKDQRPVVNEKSTKITPVKSPSPPAPMVKPAVQRSTVKVVQPTVNNPIAPYINHQYMWDVGIDGLRDAVWTPDDTKTDLNTPPRLEAGLDCLRYAVWTPENTNQELVTSGQPTRLEVTTAGLQVDGHFGEQCVTPADLHNYDSYSIPEDSNEEALDWTVVSRKPRKAKETPSDHVTPAQDEAAGSDVEVLQTRLEELYSECKDLSTLSVDGYKPHLTLGQCDSNKVDRFIEKLKNNWKDIEFKVDSIYIIKRSCANSPFEVSKTIPIGMSY